MDINQEQQELMYRLSIFEQQINQAQEQIEIIEKGIIELKNLDSGIEELKNSKGKEINAQVGRGIFVKAQLLSEELLVDIGNKTLVKKSIDETKKILKEQIEKLEIVRKQLENSLDEINKEMTHLIDGLN